MTTPPDNIPCPHCLQPVEFNASQPGQPGKCPSCRKSFHMPDESTCVVDPQLLLLIQSRDLLRTIRTAVIASAGLTAVLICLVFALGKTL